MSLSEEQLNIIQKFLRDDLSEKDQILFDTWSGDTNFRKELFDQTSILNAVETSLDLELKNKIMSWGDSKNGLETSDKLQPEEKQKNSWWKYLIILSALLGALWLYKTYSPSEIDYNQVYASNFQVIPSENNQRGTADVYGESFSDAMEMYSNKKYQKAYDILSGISEVTPKVKSYKAICLMKLSKFDNAEALWEEVRQEGSLEEIQNADWYSLLIELINSDSKAMTKHLSEILSDPNHLYYNKALELQKDLK